MSENTITIGEARRNRRDVIRVSVGQYDGRTFIYTQVIENEEGERGEGRPSRAGLTLRPGVLRDLIPLFEAALETAAKLGEGAEE